jgi:hypothetical protein
MALTLAKNSRARCCSHVSKYLLLAVSLFGISLIGCNNTCFVFSSNPVWRIVLWGDGDSYWLGACRTARRTRCSC